MISSLSGRVEQVRGNQVEVEVGGVGYEVWMGKRSFSEGDDVKVFTYMAVSENNIGLYGFETREELDLFKMLITVSGVGPKTGAQILSQAKAEEVVKAIGEAEVKFFEKIKGVGKKTAQRLIVDLKSKIGGLGELNLKDELPLLEDEVTMALRQLGFEKREIEKVRSKLPDDVLTLEERISWCLENLG